MTDERDPALQALFAEAEQDLPAEDFTHGVMAQVEAEGKQFAHRWLLGAVVLLACAWFLAAPVQEAVALLTQGLSVTLVDMENPFLAQVLSPVNSVAGMIGFGFLGMWAVGRRVFRSNW